MSGPGGGYCYRTVQVWDFVMSPLWYDIMSLEIMINME